MDLLDKVLGRLGGGLYKEESGGPDVAGKTKTREPAGSSNDDSEADDEDEDEKEEEPRPPTPPKPKKKHRKRHVEKEEDEDEEDGTVTINLSSLPLFLNPRPPTMTGLSPVEISLKRFAISVAEHADTRDYSKFWIDTVVDKETHKQPMVSVRTKTTKKRRESNNSSSSDSSSDDDSQSKEEAESERDAEKEEPPPGPPPPRTPEQFRAVRQTIHASTRYLDDDDALDILFTSKHITARFRNSVEMAFTVIKSSDDYVSRTIPLGTLINDFPYRSFFSKFVAGISTVNQTMSHATHHQPITVQLINRQMQATRDVLCNLSKLNERR